MSFDCDYCHGTNEVDCFHCSHKFFSYEKCSMCYGSKGIYKSTNIPLNYGTIFVPCYSCNGSGLSNRLEKCIHCNGSKKQKCTATHLPHPPKELPPKESPPKESLLPPEVTYSCNNCKDNKYITIHKKEYGTAIRKIYKTDYDLCSQCKNCYHRDKPITLLRSGIVEKMSGYSFNSKGEVSRRYNVTIDYRGVTVDADLCSAFNNIYVLRDYNSNEKIFVLLPNNFFPIKKADLLISTHVLHISRGVCCCCKRCKGVGIVVKEENYQTAKDVWKNEKCPMCS